MGSSNSRRSPPQNNALLDWQSSALTTMQFSLKVGSFYLLIKTIQHIYRALGNVGPLSLCIIRENQMNRFPERQGSLGNPISPAWS